METCETCDMWDESDPHGDDERACPTLWDELSFKVEDSGIIVEMVYTDRYFGCVFYKEKTHD